MMRRFLPLVFLLFCVAISHASPRRAMVVVDATNKQFAKAGDQSIEDVANAAIATMVHLLSRSNGTQEWDAIFDCRDYTISPEDTTASGGDQLVPHLEKLRAAAALEGATGPRWAFVGKPTMSCLHDTGMMHALLTMNIDELYVIGFNTEQAIFATVFDAWRSGVTEKVFLVADAVASMHGYHEHSLGMEMVRATVCGDLNKTNCSNIVKSVNIPRRSKDIPATTTTSTTTSTTMSICDSSWHQSPFVGVNLGGWLVAENWMWPSQMRPASAGDEWVLVQKLGGAQSSHTKAIFQNHWDAFVTEDDLDRLKAFGVSHLRIPVGYWLLDYRVEDGFVDGGMVYLNRLMMWMKQRCMMAVFDIHALPGGQEAHESFTGKSVDKPYFFLEDHHYQRGKEVVYKMADLIRKYENDPSTSGVALGLSPANEPSLNHWAGARSQQEFYKSVVSSMRDPSNAHYLDPSRFTIYLNYMGRASQMVDWLVQQPWARSNIVLDKHVYHKFDTKCDLPATKGGLQDQPHLHPGDNHGRPCDWPEESDSCKSCCRDRWFLEPVTSAKFPLIVGEWSVATLTEANITAKFRQDFFKQQLAFYAETPDMQGSFFWSFKTEEPLEWKEWCLLWLIENDLRDIELSETDLSFASTCPKSLSQCPDFGAKVMENSLWKATCEWQDLPCTAHPVSTRGNTIITSGDKVTLVAFNGKAVYVEGEVARQRCASAGAYQELHLQKRADVGGSNALSHGDVVYLSVDSITWDRNMYYLETDWDPSQPGMSNLVRAKSTSIHSKGQEYTSQAFTVERAAGPGPVRSGDKVHLRTLTHKLVGAYAGDTVKSLHYQATENESFTILAI